MTTHFQDRRVAWLDRLVNVEVKRPSVLPDEGDYRQIADETAKLVRDRRLGDCWTPRCKSASAAREVLRRKR
jgi:hypothetical protein